MNEQEKESPFLQLLETIEKRKNYTLPLDEDIIDVVYYREALDTIGDIQGNEVLTTVIDTIGGDLHTAFAIIDAIQNCEGTVVAHIRGKAYSAGSMIALAHKNIIVSPFATMMIHDYSSGSFGKGGEIISHTQFQHKWVHEHMAKIYKDFLTESEMKDLFSGKDFWFDAKEIYKRLKNRERLQKPTKVKKVAAPEYNPQDVAFKPQK